jgi:hypothetical protein
VKDYLVTFKMRHQLSGCKERKFNPLYFYRYNETIDEALQTLWPAVHL